MDGIQGDLKSQDELVDDVIWCVAGMWGRDMTMTEEYPWKNHGVNLYMVISRILE